jgi:O-antigen/teichoic acid export membrane protein
VQAAIQSEAPPRLSLIRRVSQGASVNLLGQFINVIGQLVQVPLLLAAWGTTQYGEWLSISAVVAYLSLLDFGVQTYATNRLTQCRATGDRDQYTRVLQSAWALDVTLAATAAAIVIPALMILPFDRWLHLNATGHGVAWMAASLLAVQTIAALPFGLLTGIYRTLNEYPREQFIVIARQALVIVATVATASLGGGVAAVAAAQLGAIALPGLYAWHDIRARHPEARLGFSHASRTMALSFLHPSLLFLLIQLAGAAVLQGATLMAGGMFGAAAVATFVSLRTLANLSQQGITSVRNALWPEVAAMDAVGDHSGLRLLHTLLAKLAMLIWLCAAVVLFFEGETLVRIWSKGRIPFDHAVMSGILVLYGSYSFWATSSVLLGASNRHKAMTWLFAGGTAVGLPLSWLLGRQLGLPGLVYGITIADIAVAGLWIPRIACHSIGQSYTSFLLQVVARGVVAALPVVAVAYAATVWMPVGASLLRIFILAAIVGLCGFAMLFAVWLNSAERRHVIALSRRVLGR